MLIFITIKLQNCSQSIMLLYSRGSKRFLPWTFHKFPVNSFSKFLWMWGSLLQNRFFQHKEQGFRLVSEEMRETSAPQPHRAGGASVPAIRMFIPPLQCSRCVKFRFWSWQCDISNDLQCNLESRPGRSLDKTNIYSDFWIVCLISTFGGIQKTSWGTRCCRLPGQFSVGFTRLPFLRVTPCGAMLHVHRLTMSSSNLQLMITLWWSTGTYDGLHIFIYIYILYIYIHTYIHTNTHIYIHFVILSIGSSLVVGVGYLSLEIVVVQKLL